MNLSARTLRFAAACLVLVLRPAAGAESAAESAADSGAAPQATSGTAAEPAATVHQATRVVALDAPPAPQGRASAPIVAAADAAEARPPSTPDWSFTPRRSFQGRRR